MIIKIVGYEFMLDKQKKKFNREFSLIAKRTFDLEKKNLQLRIKLRKKFP